MDALRADALLTDLDERQREAVTTAAQPLLVIAGAGSGKTRVLTRRLAWREATGALDAGHTLALTFTRKAAGELRARLAQLGLGAALTAGTFHAVALAQLRRRALDRGESPPALLDNKVRLLSRILGVAEAAERNELYGAFASEIEWAKARLVGPGDYADVARQAHRSVEGARLDDVGEIYARYEAEKTRRGVMDFEDLLDRLAFEIEQDPAFAAAQRWMFRHLFVDELQDANRAQLRLLDAWLGERSDLFAVGDASQAIYGWNGADPSGVTNFTRHYPGAQVIELDANYRSTPQVVAVASSVLAARPAGLPRTPRPDGPAPALVRFSSEFDEADAIASSLHEQRRRGRRFSDCAVLARTNGQLIVLEAALDRAGVPLRARGAHGFLARASVRAALRPIATVSQPARFSRWREELLLATPTFRGLAEDEEVAQIALARDRADRRALAELASEYARLDPLPTGRGFVAFLRHGLSGDPAPVEEDAVDVLTFHRSKGLEWPVVFVTGLEDGYVPIARASTAEALEEERRLLYVALSRAEDELHCSWAATRHFGESELDREPSPYVELIDQACGRLVQRPDRGAEVARRALAESRRALGLSDAS